MSRQRQHSTASQSVGPKATTKRLSDGTTHAKPTMRSQFAVRNPVAIASAVLDSIQRERSSAGSSPPRQPAVTSDTSHVTSSSCTLPSITNHMHTSTTNHTLTTADARTVTPARAPSWTERPCTRGRAQAASSDTIQAPTPPSTSTSAGSSQEFSDVRLSAPFRTAASSSSSSIGMFSLTRPSWAGRTSEPGTHLHASLAYDGDRASVSRASDSGSVQLGAGGRRLRFQNAHAKLTEEEESGEGVKGDVASAPLMAGERSSCPTQGQRIPQAVRLQLERAAPVSLSLPHPISSGQILKPIEGYPSGGPLNPKPPVGTSCKPVGPSAEQLVTRPLARFSEPGGSTGGHEEAVGTTSTCEEPGVVAGDEGPSEEPDASYEEDLQYVTEEELQYIKANYSSTKSNGCEGAGSTAANSGHSTAGTACRLPPKAGSTGSLRRTLSNTHRHSVKQHTMATPVRPTVPGRLASRTQASPGRSPHTRTAEPLSKEPSMPHRLSARCFDQQELAGLQARACEQEVDWDAVVADAEAAAAKAGEGRESRRLSRASSRSTTTAHHSCDQDLSGSLDVTAYEEDLKYVTADELRSVMKRFESLPKQHAGPHQPAGAPQGPPRRMASLRTSRS